VTVRTYWAWETTAALRLLGGPRVAHGGGEGRGHIVSPRAQHVIFCLLYVYGHVLFLRTEQTAPVTSTSAKRVMRSVAFVRRMFVLYVSLKVHPCAWTRPVLA